MGGGSPVVPDRVPIVFISHQQEACMWPLFDFDSLIIVVLLTVLVVLGLALVRVWRRNQQLQQLGLHMQALMDSIPDLTWVKDTRSRFLFVNAQFGRTFGRIPKDLVGLSDYDLSTREAADGYIADDMAVLKSGQQVHREETITGEGGREAWAETVKVPLFDRRGKVIGTAGMARDITERKRAELMLRHMAHHDYLTNLANRPALAANFDAILQRAQLAHQCVALFFIDLDNFKDLNDARGHGVGDAILKLIAERLEGFIGPDDALGRFGGDEFVVVLGQQPNRLAAIRAGQQLRHLFEVPLTLNEVEFAISCSIGMSTYPEDGQDYDTLIRNADMAMYYAKTHGKSRMVEFNLRMGQDNLRRIGIEQHLKDAIRREEFSLHYQPKIMAGSHEMVGMEVLLRWTNAELGSVPPDQFIPVAEQSRLILDIGDWVLEQAMKQNLAWQRQGLPLLPIAVNMSAIQVHQHDFVPRLISRMARLGYPGSRLELELTEGVVMEGATPVRRYFEQLRQLGVKISIDDFGTGYSNLGYLSRFPLDTLKIDRSFVTNIHQQQDNQQIVKAIIQLARSLSLSLVAEGVENEQELEFVEALGVEVVQGYHFSRPLPADELMHFLGNIRGVA
jgi:diguanylate cyclase (GGDEF)-like protein/PAS domain S-box-containing protein